MKTISRTLIAGATGLAAMALGATAFAESRHDHRGHAQHHYDYAHDKRGDYGARRYDKDGYYVSYSVGYAAHGDRHRHKQKHKKHARPHHYKSKQRRILRRETFPTRYRAQITLTEYYVGRGRSARLICDVYAVGPQARYVSGKRLNRVAKRHCSPRARIVI
ncbi:MAG: hypothetical protein AAGC77_00690 [Pseudomonadota bacterium]